MSSTKEESIRKAKLYIRLLHEYRNLQLCESGYYVAKDLLQYDDPICEQYAFRLFDLSYKYDESKKELGNLLLNGKYTIHNPEVAEDYLKEYGIYIKSNNSSHQSIPKTQMKVDSLYKRAIGDYSEPMREYCLRQLHKLADEQDYAPAQKALASYYADPTHYRYDYDLAAKYREMYKNNSNVLTLHDDIWM